MDLETIANVAVSSWNLNLSAGFTSYLLAGAFYHFPTIVAPALIYPFVKRTAAKYSAKIKPLITTLEAAAIATIPMGFLVGIIMNDNQFGFNNMAAYLFGAALIASYHYASLPASAPAPAPIK
ncbi:MAG: hypothetical protein AABX75_01275 [Nanoarchaeota archaeon]